MRILILLLLISGCCHPAKSNHSQVVWLIYTNKPDRTIERIFSSKKQAENYIETYKDNHDYYLEELELE